MKGFELEARLTYLDDNNQRQTLCGVAGVAITQTYLKDAKALPAPFEDAMDELLLTAKRLLRKEQHSFGVMNGLASHNLRHLADLMDNDPDFQVKTATENGRRFVLFNIPDKGA